jgi:predicted O-methyltransferase YrrM
MTTRMLDDRCRTEIDRLWARKVDQDRRRLSKAERHRNLEPHAAELLSALAAGLGAKRIVEIGGSSGLSTIALAAAAKETGGTVISIELEPVRQAEAKETLARVGLAAQVDLRLGDAAAILPTLGVVDLAFIDCEKDDYPRFFDLLKLAPGAVVVADNVISHGLTGYIAHVRAKPGVESITLTVGSGLEVTRVL